MKSAGYGDPAPQLVTPGCQAPAWQSESREKSLPESTRQKRESRFSSPFKTGFSAGLIFSGEKIF
jgi:hypothetical protein